MSRYVVSGGEGDYQPGTENRVLENLVCITDPTEMNIAETELLEVPEVTWLRPLVLYCSTSLVQS